MADLRPIPMNSRAAPGLHVSLESGPEGKPRAVIVSRHEAAPHYVAGRIEVHSIAQIDRLVRLLQEAREMMNG
jgi:hypothetical protein